MGLIAPRSSVPPAQASATKSYWKTRLQTAQGLNSVSFPGVGRVYVYSPDDPRPPDGEHAVPSGLDTKTLRTSRKGQ